jgi:hypothetical protein
VKECIRATSYKYGGMIMNKRKNQGKRVLSFSSAAIAAILLFCPISAFGQDVPKGNLSDAESTADMIFMLLKIQADVQGNLTDLDMDVAEAAQNLSTAGLEGTAAHEVLHKLLETNSNLAQAAIFSKEGKIIIAEGKESNSGEGANISSQEHIARVLKTKTPTFSKQFLLVEGYNGTSLDYPVILTTRRVYRRYQCNYRA